MPAHEPHEEALVEEMRALARRRFGPKQQGRAPVEHRLVNIDRMTTLFSIVENPYHKIVLERFSTLELMRICAMNLLESFNYRDTGKLLIQIDKLEQARAARAHVAPPEPEPAPPPAEPEDTYVLDPTALPVAPVLSPEVTYLRSLSDRDLARHFHASRRDGGLGPPAPPSNDWNPRLDDP